MIEGSYGESGHDEKCEWASEACGCDSRKLLRAEIAVATKELTRLSVEIVRAGRELNEARKALDFTEQAPGRIQEIMRSNGLVIDDLGDAHQKLAFTVYTELCECASQCEAARAAAKGGEDE